MNKPAVTQAQLQRTVKALEAMGKTVGGFDIAPDGSVRVILVERLPQVLTAPGGAVLDPAFDDGSLEALGGGHGHG